MRPRRSPREHPGAGDAPSDNPCRADAGHAPGVTDRGQDLRELLLLTVRPDLGDQQQRPVEARTKALGQQVTGLAGRAPGSV